ncbi:hypothetical protein Srot_1163 [Segniliparus rotundus DSM 44985]|uniref:Uncharacterized protein n=2 Tax=Segniliparus rotundus TaxID=286802 RepID=D6ZFB1_SEGRD|nr:hypothetical protein Srot_1163 [Segniliparus rotundus DSM 44985]
MKLYKTTIAGIERIVQLSDEDAAKQGLTASDALGDADFLDKPLFTGKSEKPAAKQAPPKPQEG